MTDPETIAKAWLAGYNAHDAARVAALYAAESTHTSPRIRALHPDTNGQLRGRAAIEAWFRAAIERLPKLRYEPIAITATAERVIIEYVRHVEGEPPSQVAEAFDLNRGEIVASRVYTA